MAEQEIFRRRQAAPIIDSISSIQSVQTGFIEQGRGGDDPPLGVVGRMGAELEELTDAIKTGDRAEIAGELADVYLLMTRIAHSYAIPLEVAISDKIARNNAKYNPVEMEALRAKGMSSEQVESHLKSRWDRDRDKTEFSRIQDVRSELAYIARTQSLNGHAVPNGHTNGTRPRPAIGPAQARPKRP